MDPAGDSARFSARLGRLALFQLAFVAAITLLKSAANAAVLSRFQADVLPYLYVTAAALTAIFSGLATAPSASLRPGRLALWGVGFCVLGAGSLWAGWSAVALPLYVFSETYATFLSIVFWNALGEAFDARQARHAFSWVSGVGMAGTVLGGSLAQALARSAGTPSLLALAAVCLGAGVLLLRGEAAPPRPRSRAPAASSQQVWSYVRSHGYARAVLAVVLSMAVLSAFVDFYFRQRAASQLGENELAALFGNLQLWVGLFAVAFQLAFAERLLSRLGLVRYLLVVPVLLLIASVAALFDGRLESAYVLKAVETAASLSILPVALQLFYAPVPDGLRAGVRGALDGLVKKGGLALGGLLLIGAAGHLVGQSLPISILALCLVALATVLHLRGRYVDALKERVGGADERLELGDSGGGMLEAALASSSPERVLRSISLLEQAGAPLRPYVAALIAYPHERVQEKGLQLATSLGAIEAAPRVEELLQSPHRRPRDAAVWALFALAPARAREVVPALLETGDLGLRCAAIGALLSQQEGGYYPAQLALQQLAARGALAPVAERREVARLLGRLENERWASFLLRYLDDADGSVRRIAIDAVGEGGYCSLAPRLLPFLTWREERRHARQALTSLGSEVVGLLEQALNDRNRPLSLRYQVPRVLRQIGTQPALDALLFSNVRDDAFLHYRVGVALSRLRDEKKELVIDRAQVRQALARRREVYRTLLGPYLDLRAGLGDQSLLTRAVADRLDQAFELSFWLLGLLYEPRALQRAHAHLLGAEPRRRALALELLENLLAQEDLELVREQIDAPHRRLLPSEASRLTDRLLELCTSEDPVLRACARRIGRTMGLWARPPGEDDMNDEKLKRMFAMEGVEIFTQSDVDDIAAVAELAREVRFRKGERIFAEGDPGDALYVIVEGRVEARRGEEVVLTLRQKEAFGEVSLFDGAPRPTDVVALEDVVALVIDRRDFLDLLSDRPELLRGMFRVLSEQLKRIIDQPARRNTGELRLAAVAPKSSGG